MRKLFLDVKAALKDSGHFRYVSMYRGQDLVMMEKQNRELAIDTPAAFIYFKEPVQFDTMPLQYQEGTVLLAIRCMSLRLDDYDEEFFDLMDKVHEAVDQLKDINNEYTTLVRKESTQDVYHDGLLIPEFVYSCRVLERPIDDKNQKYPFTIDNLNIEVNGN